MSETAGSSKSRLLIGAAAFLSTVFTTASVLSLMYSKYPAIGGASFIGMALLLLPMFALGLVCGRGKFRAFCLGAAFPAAFAFYSAAATVETLFRNLPPGWPPSLAGFDEPSLIAANRSLGPASRLAHAADQGPALRRSGRQAQAELALSSPIHGASLPEGARLARRNFVSFTPHCGLRTTRSEMAQALTSLSDSTCRPIWLSSRC